MRWGRNEAPAPSARARQPVSPPARARQRGRPDDRTLGRPRPRRAESRADVRPGPGGSGSQRPRIVGWFTIRWAACAPEVGADQGGQLAYGRAGAVAEPTGVELGACRQVVVERQLHHAPAACAEVRPQAGGVDRPGGPAYRRDHGDRALGQLPVTVGVQPVEGCGRAAGAVHARGGGKDQLVGQVEDSVHRGLQQAGAGVGERDRVPLREQLQGGAVAGVGECARAVRSGEHREAARRRRDVPVEVDEVAGRREAGDPRRRAVPDAAGQRAGVRARVDRHDGLATLGREHRAQREDHGGLAGAALGAQHGDPPTPVQR